VARRFDVGDDLVVVSAHMVSTPSHVAQTVVDGLYLVRRLVLTLLRAPILC
jgi:hypothetical protein